MNIIKKQAAGVLGAALLVVMATIIFNAISILFTKMYGDIAESAYTASFTVLSRKYYFILVVWSLLYIAISFSKEQFIHKLDIICGIVMFLVCVAVGIHDAILSPSYVADDAMRYLYISTTRVLVIYFGIAFPLTYILFCAQLSSSSIKTILINQLIVFCIYLVLTIILSLVLLRMVRVVPLNTAIGSCISSFLLLVPALNINRIKQSIKK